MHSSFCLKTPPRTSANRTSLVPLPFSLFLRKKRPRLGIHVSPRIESFKQIWTFSRSVVTTSVHTRLVTDKLFIAARQFNLFATVNYQFGCELSSENEIIPMRGWPLDIPPKNSKIGSWRGASLCPNASNRNWKLNASRADTWFSKLPV